MYKHIPKYHLLRSYNVIYMCVFRADFWYWIASWCAFSWGELRFLLGNHGARAEGQEVKGPRSANPRRTRRVSTVPGSPELNGTGILCSLASARLSLLLFEDWHSLSLGQPYTET